jgi:hypothetical protein
LAMDGDKWQHHALIALLLAENISTHWIEFWGAPELVSTFWRRRNLFHLLLAWQHWNPSFAVGCNSVNYRWWTTIFFVPVNLRPFCVACFSLSPRLDRGKKKKVKQSHYRPGQAHRVPGGRGSKISF